MDDRELLNVVMGIVGKEKCRDDCAEVPFGHQIMVVTTDMLHRTTDFVDGMSTWQMGWMSAAVTLSDIASMGAEPKYLLIAVGLDTWQDLAGVMQGAQDCCTMFGAEIIGGDIDRHGELTIVTTGLGLVDMSSIVRRTGAQPGDLVCITGIPGQAQAYLDGFPQYQKALFEPQPRVKEGRLLARGGVSAMMDDSDGVALSLYDLMSVNECGFSLDSARLPCSLRDSCRPGTGTGTVRRRRLRADLYTPPPPPSGCWCILYRDWDCNLRKIRPDRWQARRETRLPASLGISPR